VRILYGKCFGIGNAIMAIPALRALRSMGHQVDVLVGTLPDDGGAVEVLSRLRDYEGMGIIGTVYRDNALPARYDLAIMAIPFDGRWRNGTHYIADKVMDGRTRPDPATTGLISWKKHEIEYQMDNARELGYSDEIPSCSFLSPHLVDGSHSFYLGIGYKKDAAGFWKAKHWGNENFAALVKFIADHPLNRVFTTGDMQDLVLTIAPIMRMVNDKRFIHEPGSLVKSFDSVADCGFYVGNDTGMMHVAAAFGRKALGLFFLENSIVKSKPWCKDGFALDGVGRNVTPEEVFRKIKEMGG
jgi:hypothetical protein